MIWDPYDERTTHQWDALNRELRKVLGNGMTVSHPYDSDGRELLLENRKSDGAGIAVYLAQYDNANNRLNVVELDRSRVTYGYDEAYRLTSEVRSSTWPYDIQYEYDGCMNRRWMIESGAVTSYSHNAANELLVVQPFNAFPTSMLSGEPFAAILTRSDCSGLALG